MTALKCREYISFSRSFNLPLPFQHGSFRAHLQIPTHASCRARVGEATFTAHADSGKLGRTRKGSERRGTLQEAPNLFISNSFFARVGAAVHVGEATKRKTPEAQALSLSIQHVTRTQTPD